ncbi:MAG: L-aspartate oxidase, partial [Pseudomonadota bacterium]|nr:L-aspartate oxidase [Pseudomonadota bacterium]
MSARTFDVLIIGSGAAGLTAALNLAPRLKVGVIAKGALGEGATGWAQGGIAAVLEEGDSFEAHVRDTMIAGAGLNKRDVVEHVVSQAPAAIARLAELGVPFNADGDGWHLTREGGHSHRRIVHVADATGWAIQQALEKAAAAHPNISLVPGMVAIDLVTGRHAEEFSTSGAVHGLYAFDRTSGRVETLLARATILATGGAGRAYLYSTAPRGATGDGIAMAWRAGCRVSNMEFMQFHPTCLYNLEVKNFLITEAVRGEGGLLVNPETNERFMPAYDERAELAPRDIVARAIDHQIKRDGLDCVHLDISHREPDFVKAHFPNIYEKLLGLGIDITKEPIPVVPAQHYTCGGVLVDINGCTDAPGLYAAGEVAQGGLHGANRLASNSLLECLVFGEAAAKHILAGCDGLPNPPAIRGWDESRVEDSDEEVVIQQCWGEIRRFMWNFVGIVRTTKRLERAKRRIDMLRQEVADYYRNFRVTPDLIELRNLVEV